MEHVESRAISTVSTTYAQEIQTPEYGKGLEGVLHNRRASVFGLLNGVNYQQWSPETDSLSPARYTPNDLSGPAIDDGQYHLIPFAYSLLIMIIV